MQILKALLLLSLSVAPFEIQSRFVGLGDDKMAQVKADPSDQCGTEKVGVEESLKLIPPVSMATSFECVPSF